MAFDYRLRKECEDETGVEYCPDCEREVEHTGLEWMACDCGPMKPCAMCHDAHGQILMDCRKCPMKLGELTKQLAKKTKSPCCSLSWENLSEEYFPKGDEVYTAHGILNSNLKGVDKLWLLKTAPDCWLYEGNDFSRDEWPRLYNFWLTPKQKDYFWEELERYEDGNMIGLASNYHPTDPNEGEEIKIESILKEFQHALESTK
jgi:hypothetical protein